MRYIIEHPTESHEAASVSTAISIARHFVRTGAVERGIVNCLAPLPKPGPSGVTQELVGQVVVERNHRGGHVTTVHGRVE